MVKIRAPRAQIFATVAATAAARSPSSGACMSEHLRDRFASARTRLVVTGSNGGSGDGCAQTSRHWSGQFPETSTRLGVDSTTKTKTSTAAAAPVCCCSRRVRKLPEPRERSKSSPSPTQIPISSATSIRVGAERIGTATLVRATNSPELILTAPLGAARKFA